MLHLDFDFWQLFGVAAVKITFLKHNILYSSNYSPTLGTDSTDIDGNEKSGTKVSPSNNSPR